MCMNVDFIEKNITFNSNTKVSVMRGFYNNEGEYCEEYMENIPLCELPQKAIERVNLEYDITTLYTEQEVLVIAKELDKIYEYKELEAKPRFFHGLLNLPEHRYYDGYMCIFTDLESLKKSQKKQSET